MRGHENASLALTEHHAQAEEDGFQRQRGWQGLGGTQAPGAQNEHLKIEAYRRK